MSSRWIVLTSCGVSAFMALGCDPSSGAGLDSSAAEPDGATRDDAAPTQCITGDSSSPIGGPCNCARDCVDGTVCTPEADSGGTEGQCNRVCVPGSAECGAGNVCFEVSGTGMGLCANECAGHDECRDGWACFYGRCVSHCTTDEQCRSGECDPYRASCAAPTGATGGVLAACSRDEDCRSGACLLPIGGHCLSFCSPELGGCPDDAHCVGGIDPTDAGVGICMLRCVTSEDCPGQLDCLNTGDGRTACWVPAG